MQQPNQLSPDASVSDILTSITSSAASPPSAAAENGAATIWEETCIEAFCGIDFGSFKGVVTSATTELPNVIDVNINGLSNRSTPCMVSFQKSLRTFGEAAEDRVASSPENSVTQISALFGSAEESNAEELLSLLRKRMEWRLRGRPLVRTESGSARSKEDVSFQFDFNEQTMEISLRHLTGYVLRCYLDFCLDSRNLSGKPHKCRVAIAVPSHFSDSSVAAIQDSCCIAGLTDFSILRQDDAIRNLWITRNIPSITDRTLQQTAMLANDAKQSAAECNGAAGVKSEPCGARGVVVGIVDFGFTQTTVQFFTVTPPSGTAATDAKEASDCSTSKSDGTAAEQTKIEVLDRQHEWQLGTADVLNLLVAEACRRLKANHGERACVDLTSRKGWRLAQQCAKLMKDLSGLPNSSLELEAFIDDDTDFKMNISRAEYEELCEPLQTRLRQLMTQCLSKAISRMGYDFTSTDTSVAIGQGGSATDEDPTSASTFIFCGVELVGGGTRIPWVQQIIDDAVGGPPAAETSRLRRTMDSSAAAATGAALFSGGTKWIDPMTSTFESCENLVQADVSMDIQNIIAIESQIQQVEKKELMRREKYNELESFIFEMRTALSSKGDLFGTAKNDAETEVAKADDWLLSQNPEETTFEKYAEKLESLHRQLHSICPAYFEAAEADRAQKEAELEAAMQLARGEGLENEDHDNRKLPNSQRLKLAKKNKDEGNELFKGGSPELAAQRYIKALSHMTKMFDTSPQDEEEAKTVKSACHLNLAQVYLRLDTESSYKKAVASCTSALDINPNNTKSLFRRAQAHEKLRDFEKAMLDLKKAKTLSEEKDPDILKAIDRVQKHIKQQESRAKKIFAKMFSGKAD